MNKTILANAIESSGKAISALLEQGLESGKIKNFKPHAAAFQAYLIAHEAHHRALIIIALKQSGHMIDKKIAYGMWEWGVR